MSKHYLQWLADLNDFIIIFDMGISAVIVLFSFLVCTNENGTLLP